MSVVVKATDASGLATARGLAVTGADGLTPSDALGRALVVAAREFRPTDDPARPRLITRTYRLRVTAPGFAPRDVELRPHERLPRPVVVALRRIGRE